MVEQYDPIAGKYAEAQRAFFEGMSDPAREFIYKRLPQQKDIQVLDIGCGPGTDVDQLKNLGYQNVSGIDPSAESIALAQSRAAKSEDFKVGSYEATGFPDKSVDFIMGRYSLMYVRDIDGAYREMARILRPGGKLVAVVSNPAADSLEKREDTAEGPQISFTLYDGKITITMPLHVREEYFSETFHELFDLDQIQEFGGPDRISKDPAVMPALAIVAIRKSD